MIPLLPQNYKKSMAIQTPAVRFFFFFNMFFFFLYVLHFFKLPKFKPAFRLFLIPFLLFVLHNMFFFAREDKIGLMMDKMVLMRMGD